MKNHYINGQWYPGEGQPFTSLDPTTQAVLWQGKQATHAEIDAAIAAATTAFASWRHHPVTERQVYLQRYADCLRNNKTHLAETLSQETGKPHWEALLEVSAMINKIAITEQAYLQRSGWHKQQQDDGVTLVVDHRPQGVIAVLGPFNMPGHLPNGHIVPALLAGNTVVFKASEYTPLVAAEMVDYWHQAGLPEGVLNLLQGGAEVGWYLATHAQIDGVFFTGSYATGLRLSEHFGQFPQKILALEMGGNNPLIVAEVNDNVAAAYHTIQSAFLSSGQRCSCARRLIVPEGKAGDAFIEQLLSMMRRIVVGPYQQRPEPFMGPLITEMAVTRLLQAQQQLLLAGAQPLFPLQRLTAGTGFLAPGLLDVTSVDDRPDIEYFGPLLQLIRVPNFTQAIREANHTVYGLSAGLFSDNPQLFEHFWLSVRAGVINWNRPLTGASSQAPFGGVGYSGNHRPSAYYAADYCAYPVASQQIQQLSRPMQLTPGVSFP